jgi:hypothetical protein
VVSTKTEVGEPHDRVKLLRDIGRIRGDQVNPPDRAERSDRLTPVFQACGGSRASERTWSNEAGSPAVNDHSNTSINEPGAEVSTGTGTISVLAKFMLQQITQKSAETARLLLRRREGTRKRTLINTSSTNSINRR